MKSYWTDEQSALLKELHLKSELSFKDISELVNARFNTTYSRNAMIGRAKRMGLPLRGGPAALVRPTTPRIKKTVVRIQRANSQGALRVYETEVFEEPEQNVVGFGLTIEQLNIDNCRFIVSEEPTLYCGKRIFDRSFCKSCYRRCYVPVRERKAA